MQTPLAEPVPEPEPVVRSISIPGYRIYRIPLAEPEQQQVKRVWRRIVGTQKLPVSVTDMRHSTVATVSTSSTDATSSSTEIPIGLETNTSEEHLLPSSASTQLNSTSTSTLRLR